MSTRILFAANRGFALIGSRIVLMRRLVRDGCQVAVATADDDEAKALEAMGIRRFVVDFRRGGVKPIADARAGWDLFNIYRHWRPHLVHHFHAKPVFYGSLAGRAAGVKSIVNTITGLGESLPATGVGAYLARAMYRCACRSSDLTVFQNHDDLVEFQRLNIAESLRSRLITSSGVDTKRFRPKNEVLGPPRVLMMSRLLKKKGVREYIKAARIVRSELGDNAVNFELAGEWDLQHPDAITEAELAAWNHDGAVRFVGYCTEPENWLRGASAFVCPSIYREGVPRVILEAAASGVPVIGTDAPGIRDVLQEGKTGYLVPPNDVEMIADRLMQLLTTPGEVARMGMTARRLMEDSFDIERITDQYCELYREAGLK